MMLKLGHFGEQIRNTWKVLKCGAGEVWTDRVRNGEVLHKVKEGTNFLHTISRRPTGTVTCCVRIAF